MNQEQYLNHVLGKLETAIGELSGNMEARREEIAKMLRCKHSTIRSKYRRALKKLERKLLSEEVQ